MAWQFFMSYTLLLLYCTHVNSTGNATIAAVAEVAADTMEDTTTSFPHCHRDQGTPGHTTSFSAHSSRALQQRWRPSGHQT